MLASGDMRCLDTGGGSRHSGGSDGSSSDSGGFDGSWSDTGASDGDGADGNGSEGGGSSALGRKRRRKGAAAGGGSGLAGGGSQVLGHQSRRRTRSTPHVESLYHCSLISSLARPEGYESLDLPGPPTKVQHSTVHEWLSSWKVVGMAGASVK